MNKVSKRLTLFSTLFITSVFLLANIAYSSPTTTVYVNPASLTDPSSPFSVTIDVDDVTDLYAWEFKLYYDKTILTITTVQLGPLLNNTVGTGNTWGNVSITDNYNATHGRVFAGQSILGHLQGATVTTGTLATLTFTTDGPSGTTPLALIDKGQNQTKLVGYDYTNRQLYYISHYTTNGSVTISGVPEFPLGLALETALIVAVIYIWWRGRRKEPKDFFLKTPSR